MGICLILPDGTAAYAPLEYDRAAESILETIDSLFKKASGKPADLKGVYVIQGPGSFTGLRIGISVANQFAHQLKIPITGLRTEAWFQQLTDEKDFFYIQSMNRDQVYFTGFGKFASDFPPAIVSISECVMELTDQAGVQWLGQVNDTHRQFLSIFREIPLCRTPAKTWARAVQALPTTPHKIYQLIEPYYGKEPAITKRKRV